MFKKTIAIIAGTGLADRLNTFLDSVSTHHDVEVQLPNTRATVLFYVQGVYRDVNVIVLPRHGPSRDLPDRSPVQLVVDHGHAAHIWHLKELGVSAIYAFNAVGALDKSVPLARDLTFLVPDQYARGFANIPHTFGGGALEVHPSMNAPFDERCRQVLIDGIRAAGGAAIETGLYINSLGDCFESAPEVSAYQVLYAHYSNRVLGMTGGSEIQFCKQLGLPYAMICANCNWAEGLPDAEAVDHPLVLSRMAPAAETLEQIAKKVVQLESSSVEGRI